MISIVIPLYNKEKTVANTLLTVFNQTFQDFEIVIVDDGSTDNTKWIVQTFKDKLDVKYYYQENQGKMVAINNGIKKCTR